MNTYQFLMNKLKPKKSHTHKQPVENKNSIPPAPKNASIATIAVVLDGEVQEVLRAQDRLAALLLSEPKFIEVDEALEEKPTIGWKYVNDVFVKPTPTEPEA